MSTVGTGDLAGKADAAPLVIPIYCLVLLPLGLYLYHDVLDSRWRRVQNLNFYLLAYGFLYISASGATIFYTVVQATSPDFKEVGATLLALLLASYGVWKLLRLWRILTTFARLIDGPVRGCDLVLRELIPEDKKDRNFRINFFDTPWKHRIGPELTGGDSELRYEYLSDVLLDDDFPSQDAPRVSWLRRRVEVSGEDIEDAATRFALFIRFALRSPRKQLWTLVCATNPLVTLPSGRISLGRALRRLMVGGCGIPNFAQKRMGSVVNPVEVLINNVNDTELKGAGLKEIGLSFFWLAVELSHDEIAFAVGKFPPRWTRGARSNGFTYIFETAILFMLADRLELARRQSRCFSVAHIGPKWESERKQRLHGNTMAPTPGKEDVFGENLSDSNPGMSAKWETLFREETSRMSLAQSLSDCLCAFLMNNSRLRSKSKPSQILDRGKNAISQTIANLARPGVLVDGNGTPVSVDGELQDGLVVGVALQELVRTAEGAGFLVETIVGADLKSRVESKHGGQAGMGQSEVVWGLAAIVQQLGWTSSNSVREMLREWKAEWGLGPLKPEDTLFSVMREKEFRVTDLLRDPGLSSTTWLLNALEEACPDPITAFAAHADMAGVLSEAVLLSLETWCEVSDFDSSSPPESGPLMHAQSAPSVPTQVGFPVGRNAESKFGGVVGSSNPIRMSHSQPTLMWPARFGNPVLFHNKWMHWKREAQGRELYTRSSYVGIVTQSPNSSMAWVRNLA